MSEKLRNSSVTVETETHDEMEIDLLELFYRLLENAKYIIACALIGALIMATYSFVLVRPTYEATSMLYVLSSSDSAINLSDLQIGSALTSDYQQVFETWEVREMVIKNLGLSYDKDQLANMIEISNPNDTRVLSITVTSTSPAEAQAIANELASVARQYIAEVMETDSPSVFSQALLPEVPVAPRKALNTAIGFVVGALIMMAIVTVRFIMDDKIKTADDIRRYVDLPTLAIVPSNSTSNRASMAKLTNTHPAPRAERRGSK